MDNNTGFLFAGYAIIWLAFFGYCYRLSRRLDYLRRRLDALKRGEAGEPRASPEVAAAQTGETAPL
ncbi:MAG: CcmD family protein [Chloroflexi bacterium]|nr:CcmD family protein [Chloroflexota bacterium]